MSSLDDMDEYEYDRRRLPGAYSHTLHHIKELREEADALRQRGRPGDKFGVARLAWFIRNNEGYASAMRTRAAQLGVALGQAEQTAQLELFA